jgi:hypothetical protein
VSPQPARVRALRIALVLTAIFNVLALLVFVRGTPVFFAVFMFVGETLFVVAVILLLASVVVELRAKQLL